MSSNDANDRRRVNEVLANYWNRLREDRPYPKESEIEVKALADIWDSCFLVRHEPETERRYLYLYLGSALVGAYGDDLKEREICEKLVFPSNMSLIHKFDEVITKGEPVLEESQFVNSRGLPIRYRSMMLPLADAAGNVAFVLGGMRWKGY